MDNFISLAKQGYSAYQESQSHSSSHDNDNSDVRKTGGEEYNSPHHSQQGGNPQIDLDHDELVRTAQEHGPGHANDGSLYSSAHSYINQNKSQHQVPVDEEQVQNAHRQAYEEGSGSNLSASSLGSAAALQALKKFTSGGGGSGGGSQSQLISMAMGEASKLFDASGGASSGGKQDAVNGAAMTVVKLLVQSKFSGGLTGGGNSGGLGGLMSLASKFA